MIASIRVRARSWERCRSQRARRVVSSCMAFSQWSGVSARVGARKKSADLQSNPLCSGVVRHEESLPKISRAQGSTLRDRRVTRDACVQGLRPGEQLWWRCHPVPRHVRAMSARV